MKANSPIRTLALATLLLASIPALLSTALAQGTAFTYQGRLNDSGSPANGSYDLTFTLFNTNVTGSAVAGTITNSGTAISNGLFTVTLDFGNTPYLSGAPLWLEIHARTNGAAAFPPPLAPRQAVLPTPYATYAYSVNASSLIGQVTDANLSALFSSPHAFSNPGNSFTGNGSGLTALNATNLTAGTLSDLRLSTNVALRNAVNQFTGGSNLFAGSVGIGTTTPAKSLDVTGSAVGAAPGASLDPSIFVRVNNTATDGSTGTPDFAGIGFGHNSTRQAIVGGTFGNDYLDFYTGGLLTTPKLRIDYNGSITLSDPRTGSVGSGAQIALADYYSGTAESSLIDSIGNGGGFTWRNGALELRPVDRVNIYRGFDVTSASQVALTVIGSSGNVGINTPTPRHQLDVAGNIWLGTEQEGAIFTELGDTLYLGSQRKYLGNTLGAPVAGNTDWVNLMAHPLSAGIMFGLSGPSDTDPHSAPSPLMVIRSNGNVGIGTADPQTLLEVAGNGRVANFSGPGGSVWSFFDTAPVGNPYLWDIYGNTNAFAIDISGVGTAFHITKSTGNVGIGTTTPARTLEVGGSISRVSAGSSIDSSVLVRVSNSANDGNTASPDFAGIGFGRNSTQQAIVGGTFGNDFLDFYTGGLLTTPKMRIDINGGVTLSDPRTGSTGSGAQIALTDYYSGTAESAVVGSIGNGGGFNWRNGALELRPVTRLNIYKGFDVTTAAQVALTVIGSSGNVGIGTTSPDALLTVNGTADKPGGGSWGTFSDARLKDVGAEFTHGLEALDTIQPVHYHYKSGNPLNLPSQPDYIGVVAQQVQDAIPEAVQRNQDGYLVVNNDPIIWTMFNAIKELKQQRDTEAKTKDAQIEALQARLQQLEQRITGKNGGAK